VQAVGLQLAQRAAVAAGERGERLGVRFRDLARRVEGLPHHGRDTEIASFEPGDRAHGRDQVAGPVPDRVVGGLHGAREHDGLAGGEHQIQQVGGLFERVGPVGDHGSVERVAGQPLIEMAGQLEHAIGRPVRTRQPVEVFARDAREGADLRHGFQQLLAPARGDGAAARDDLHRDRSAGENHQDGRERGHGDGRV
jgi:hypothetical protein